MPKATEIQAELALRRKQELALLRTSIRHLEMLTLQLANDAQGEKDGLKRICLEQSAIRRWLEIRRMRSELRLALFRPGV